MRRLTELRETIQLWENLSRRATDLLELFELAELEGDQAVAAEVERDEATLRRELDRQEFQLAMSGEHDRLDAILSIHAGAGGTESQDWASMLLRMYLRWAERRGLTADIVDLTEGEEAGIKSATVFVRGRYAYGYLRAERGVHRLVRLSPYDASKRRHTSFALVEVVPDVPDDVEVEINPDDLKMDVYRSSGAGGQNVQKNSTAVRLTHLPTGIVVTCQNERSQLQNREMALRILRGRLIELEEKRLAEEQSKLKGEHVSANFGNQIRSYVLHPYNMVKDLRTEYETSNTGAVLDGDLDEFIEAYLKQQIGVGAA